MGIRGGGRKWGNRDIVLHEVLLLFISATDRNAATATYNGIRVLSGLIDTGNRRASDAGCGMFIPWFWFFFLFTH